MTYLDFFTPTYLIANFDVATGKIVEATCGNSRTESDFVLNIRRILERGASQFLKNTEGEKALARTDRE